MKDVEQCLFTTYEKDGVYHIQCSGLVPGPGHVYCTLIVGEERALLIDNGFGDDDFRPYLATLTDKPIIAVATHVHPDHTAGSAQFDEIWINPKDEYMIKEVHGEDSYDEETKVLFGKTKILFMEEGQVFDLGGRKVISVYTPGHTWGSTCFYDDKAKLMMTGDTINQRIFLQVAKPAVPFKRYRQSIEDLKAFEFEEMLGSHHPEPFKKSWLDNCIAIVDSFTPEKGRDYIRDGFVGLKIYTTGRGYGDPEYCGFIYDPKELANLMA